MSDNLKRVIFIVATLVLVLMIYQYIAETQQIDNPSWSEFERQVEQDNVDSVTITSSPEGFPRKIAGEYSSPVDGHIEFELAPLTLPGTGEAIVNSLREKGVEITTEVDEENWWSLLLINSLPILLIVGIWIYFIYRTRKSLGGGGVMGVGESKAKLFQEETPDVTFEKVAGYSGPKNEVQQIIEFLKTPEKFDRLGGEIPKGILMVGPPGTGKTLTARAIAGEAGVPFLSTEGSDFMEMFVGVGASRVRDLFERAKELSPAIIFIDEIDSVGRKRGAGLGGGHDEREQTLNQLLSEMDGFETNVGVILLAATNRPDILDPALLRSGRFDRQITFELPTLKERKEILRLHAKNKPLQEDVDLDEMASGTPGFSGADLRNLLNESALIAAEKGADSISRETLEEARDKVLMGLQREELAISDKEKMTMATHESGHTLVGYFSEYSDPVHKVTIIPRGRALGATQQLPLEEKKMYSREDLMARLAVLMSGRVAEDIKLNTVTNGAQDDLRRATKLARKMVLQWGMSEELGNVAFHDTNGNVFLGEDMAQRREYSEQTSQKIDDAVRQIIDEATLEARNLLEKHRDKLEKLIDVLIEKETLNAEEIKALMETGELPPAPPETEQNSQSLDQTETEQSITDSAQPDEENSTLPDDDADKEAVEKLKKLVEKSKREQEKNNPNDKD